MEQEGLSMGGRGRNAWITTQPETWADVEVEIVDERDRSQGKAATTDATDMKAADATGSSTGDAATEKEAVKSTAQQSQEEPQRHLQEKRRGQRQGP